MRKRILIISPEVYPKVKVGGLGMVVAGLVNELRKKDKIDLKVVSPNRSIYQPIWVESTKENYLELGKQAANLCQQENWHPDVVWTHDWGGAWSMKGYGGETRPKTVWTVHSPVGNEYSDSYGYGYAYGYGYGYGWGETDNEPIDWGDSFFDFSGLINQGIKQADLVTTVSEGYAKRLSRHLLFQLANKIDYVPNGLDFNAWDPKSDTLIDFNLQDSWQEFKEKNKQILQRKLNLPVKNVPLFCFVSRLVPQKGVGLLLEVLPEFLGKNEVQFVLVGSGRQHLEKKIDQLVASFPTQIGVKLEADFDLPHQVYAGGDFLVLPSVAEPFGLVVAEAKKYRVTPIVHLVDGLKDQVKEGKTGFGFYDYNQRALENKLYNALRFWHRGGFKAELDKSRKVDSWQKATDKWLNLL